MYVHMCMYVCMCVYVFQNTLSIFIYRFAGPLGQSAQDPRNFALLRSESGNVESLLVRCPSEPPGLTGHVLFLDVA